MGAPLSFERPLLHGLAFGVRPEVIRYYERRGLLLRPRRGPNGYRMYSAGHLERVEFIKKAQTLGLSLEKSREVMELKFSGTSASQHVRDLLREKVSAVDQQIARLRVFRRACRFTESMREIVEDPS
jgi:DNA-binding transcriptional MerR regulator